MKEALGAPASADVDKLRLTIDEQSKKLKEKDEHIAALQKMVCDCTRLRRLTLTAARAVSIPRFALLFSHLAMHSTFVLRVCVIDRLSSWMI